jgi:hypothetical protein
MKLSPGKIFSSLDSVTYSCQLIFVKSFKGGKRDTSGVDGG